ncbi:hypothetical protein ML401_28730 [Bradyrhizobium sp. 62B]|uniref:hypothetical protein n=1 Tax=Bradyrhizobium sp. 62B TaxID=2898442 RepID=UPI002558138D|nr:hypothetical protein ML401_28730 [Bradyrhizobium sp. 62B]
MTDFCWSGANSVFVRKTEAQRLARELRHRDKVGHEQILIAHSYAANLALLACKDCPEIHQRLRLITLASPFLQIEVTGLVSAQVNTLKTAMLTFPAFLLMLLFDFSITSPTFKYLVVNVSFLFALVPVLCGALALAWGARVLDRSYTLWDAYVPRKVLRLHEAARYSLREMTGLRMLILRGIDDEAVAAITIGAMSTQIAASFLRPMNNLCGWAFAAFALLVLPVSMFEHITGWNIGWFDLAERWLERHLSGAIPFVAAYYFGFILVAHLPRSVYGRELLVNSIRCDVVVNSVPDASEGNKVEVTTINNAQTKRGMRHGIHASLECAPTIKGWVNGADAGVAPDVST